ncbi:putative ribosomal protein S21 [Arabidopsis thaliana]
MNTIAKRVTGLVTRPSLNQQLQQERGIRVKVFSNDLDKALTILQKKMQSSGMERLIKGTQTHHIKNSEKKVLARKNLERRIKSIDFARKLQSILIKKVRFMRAEVKQECCYVDQY